jgi:prepilin-type processing-associated H-X9-DG protein
MRDPRAILDYATPPPKQRRKPFTYLELLIVVGIVALLVSILLPSLNRDRYSSNRVKCSSNLRQIGQALLLYSVDHGGRYPDSFDELLVAMNDPGFEQVFCCPDTNDTPAAGPTTQAVAANLTAGGHLSYVYAGRGWTSTTATADVVLAYEPLSNHGDGINILWGDGHVEFFAAPQAKPLLAALAAGRNPPVLTPSLSAR